MQELDEEESKDLRGERSRKGRESSKISREEEGEATESRSSTETGNNSSSARTQDNQNESLVLSEDED